MSRHRTRSGNEPKTIDLMEALKASLSVVKPCDCGWKPNPASPIPVGHQDRRHHEFHEWGWEFCAGCGDFHEPGRRFYVTVVRNPGGFNRQVGFLAGPFDEHATALALVDRCRELAESADAATAFDAFGTASTTPGQASERRGTLNDRLTVADAYPRAG